MRDFIQTVDLATIYMLALECKALANASCLLFLIQLRLVAGAGFEPTTFGL